MKSVKINFLFVSVFAILVCVSGQRVMAQDLAVDPPADWNFGNVLTGTQSTKTFVLTSIEPNIDLAIFAVAVTEGREVFSITGTDPDPMPGTLGFEETLEVYVAFEPVAPGNYNGMLTIVTNDHNDPIWESPLSGRGVDVPEPASCVLFGCAGIAALMRRRL